jgi:dihydrofolate reductase
MGKTTFFSLSKNPRPLLDRLNIVLTNEPDKYKNISNNYTNIIFTNNEKIYADVLNKRKEYISLYPFLHSNFKIFIIGGQSVYEKYMPLYQSIFITFIKNDYRCDKFFNFNEKNYSHLIVKDDCDFTIKKYTKINYDSKEINSLE